MTDRIKILTVLIFIFSSICIAQSEMIFQHLTMEDGLPDDGVEWVMQDHLGLIWIATRIGMVKYDGYEFTQYKSGSKNSVGLNKDIIRVLYEDSRGDIWAGAEGYLNRYIRHKDTIVTYQSDTFNNTSLKGEKVHAILEDSRGNMWIGNYRGWLNYVPKKQLDSYNDEIKFKHLAERDHDETYIVYSLLEDSQNNIWACTRNGLLKINNFNITVVQAVKGNKYNRNNTFFSIVEDSNNTFWIGTYGNGLANYNDSNGKFEFYPYNKTEFIRYGSNNIISLLLDSQNQLWAGTQGAGSGGLLKFDRVSKTYEKFTHINSIENSLLDGAYFHNIFEDNSGSFWMPAFQKGITRLDPSLNQTENYYYGIENDINLGKEILLCAHESSDGKTWIGSTDGILKYDQILNSFSKITLPNLRCSEKKSIRYISEDNKGNLWLSSGWSGHLWKYNPKSNLISCITHGSKDNLFPNPYIKGLAYDNTYLWISTYGGGLISLDPNSHSIKRYYVGGIGSKKDDPEEINAMSIDKSGEIWVASYDRTLNKFDKESGQFQRKSFLEFDGGFNTTGMLIDSKNRIWLATRLAGIILYDIETETHINFNTKTGLPTNDRISDFFEDNSGNIYCRSSKHLIQFSKEGKFEKYHQFNLERDELKKAFYIKSSNEIFLSTTNTLMKFEADGLMPNQTAPKMILSEFKYYDKSLKQIGSLRTKVSQNTIEKIQLEHWQNDFTIKFAGLHYTRSSDNEYKYKLENYDNQWKFSGTERTAKYTNIKYGNYIFKVLGSNCDGIWTDIPARLEIIILPPWWLTWWAYVIYSIAFLSVIIITWIMQLKRIRVKNELMMREFEAEKLKEVDQMKSNFFANISHEFRTPLTLIKGPIENLASEEKSQDKKEVFKMILKNTKRLLNLINELLDLSKLESGKMKMLISKSDIVSFTKGIVMSFNSLAESKEVTLTINSSKNIIALSFDKEKMQKILSNIISNALKFTPERGSIDVQITENLFEQNLIMEITDTGIGVAEDEIPKLFDRFYQVRREGSNHSKGTGIGLALTKELIHLHNGTIDIQSKINEGTKFTISLPLGKDNLEEDKMLSNNKNDFEHINYDIIHIEEEPINKKNKPVILVVEDNEDVLKYIQDIFKADYNVVLAQNGEEGFKKAKESIPDIIVSDIMMPLMNGNEMCKLLKAEESTSHIPVILLTAKASEEDKIEGLETGADDYILKPFDALEVIVRTKNLINQRIELRRKYLREAEIHPTEIAVTSVDKHFIEKALKFIEDEIDKSSLSVEDMAKHLNMSRAQLYRKFCGVLGEKPNEFIRKYRLKRAAKLIQNNFGNIAQVAFEVGFNDPAYFSKCFKKLYKMNPFEYEKKHKRTEKYEISK